MHDVFSQILATDTLSGNIPFLKTSEINNPATSIRVFNIVQPFSFFNILRTGDADLRFYVTTVQDG